MLPGVEYNLKQFYAKKNIVLNVLSFYFFLYIFNYSMEQIWLNLQRIFLRNKLH
jgi:hypothetical protein